MKEKRRGWISVTAYALVIALSFLFAQRLTVFKSPEFLMMEEFYRLPKNSVEVLGIGSSHAYTSFDTETLWNDYGLPAFCMSSPSQSLSTSYYYLKEALKTQSPAVVMLECSCIGTTDLDYAYGNINAVSWMRPGLNKWNSLVNTIPVRFQENMLSNLRYYHNRWRELSDADMAYAMGARGPGVKGFNPWWNYSRAENSIQVSDAGAMAPDEKGVAYMERIRALCRQNGILFLPYLSAHGFDTADYQIICGWKAYFSAQEIDFIDGVQLRDTLGIDPRVDNDLGHISYWGAQKLTGYIGNYLTGKGYAEDKSAQAGYEAWSANAGYYSALESSRELVNIKDGAQYLSRLGGSATDVAVISFRSPGITFVTDGALKRELNALGIAFDEHSDVPMLAVLQDGKPVEVRQAESISCELDLSGTYPAGIDTAALPLSGLFDDGWKLHIYAENGRSAFALQMDYKRIEEIPEQADVPLLKIYVFNTLTGETVDALAIDMTTGRRCD